MRSGKYMPKTPMGHKRPADVVSNAPADLTERVWDMADVVSLIEESEMLVPAAHAE